MSSPSSYFFSRILRNEETGAGAHVYRKGAGLGGEGPAWQQPGSKGRGLLRLQGTSDSDFQTLLSSRGALVTVLGFTRVVHLINGILTLTSYPAPCTSGGAQEPVGRSSLKSSVRGARSVSPQWADPEAESRSVIIRAGGLGRNGE